MITMNWDDRITVAHDYLKEVREEGDALKIELAEDSLNDLLERRIAVLVTGNKLKD